MPKKQKKRRATTVLSRNAQSMTEAEYWSKVRNTLRKAFAYWKPAQEALKQAEFGTRTNPKTGRQKKVYRCALCGEVDFIEEMQIDHIDPCGALRSAEEVAPFLERLTCEDSSKYQLLHKACHQAKTNEGRKSND